MSDVTMRPVRFTEDLPAMRAFCETLGLRSRVESERGGWVDLVAGAGMLALHDAASSDTRSPAGRTTLSFECLDATALAERMTAAGYEAVVYDESYGRVVQVAGVDGWRLLGDECQSDLHGYRRLVGAGDPRWTVRPVLLTAEPDAAQRLLGVLGLDVEVVRGDPPEGQELGPDGEWRPAASVRLGFTTSEPLADVGARLGEHGCAASVVDGSLAVTDPDGQRVVIGSSGPK